MTIVTVDMDDTLIETSTDYVETKTAFGELMEERFGIDADHALEVLDEIDYELVEKHGLSIDRFPTSFVKAAERLLESPSEELLEEVEALGYKTFKSEQEYRQRGFMDGAKAMLDHLHQNTENLHLVTVGDSRAQEPKIEALELHRWFDEVHIPSIDEGKSGVFTDLLNGSESLNHEHFVHIGNSATSDVEAALDVGAHAVYISDDTDWLSDSQQHETYLNHDKVYAYSSATDFVSDIDAVLHNHRPAHNIQND